MDTNNKDVIIEKISLLDNPKPSLNHRVLISFKFKRCRVKLAYCFDTSQNALPHPSAIYSPEVYKEYVLPVIGQLGVIFQAGEDGVIRILERVIAEANLYVQRNKETKQTLPSLQQLVDRLNHLGFAIHRSKSYFHCSRKSVFGVEMHIEERSIRKLIDAINLYEEDEETIEMYSFPEIKASCKWHWDLDVLTDEYKGCWYVIGVDWEEDRGEQLFETYHSLRCLEKAVIYRLQLSKANPDPVLINYNCEENIIFRIR
jgi:hypothetical protein